MWIKYKDIALTPNKNEVRASWLFSLLDDDNINSNVVIVLILVLKKGFLETYLRICGIYTYIILELIFKATFWENMNAIVIYLKSKVVNINIS